MFRHDCILVLYVDDVGVAAPNDEIIDELIEALKKPPHNLLLTREESFAEFLGIKFITKEDGSVECTQEGLIKKIIEHTGMEDCRPNSTPCTQLALGSDPDGPPMDEPWKYASIVGMLLYLSTNTRPDIAFVVSQVARFTSSPKQSHATAVKSIIRYLRGTMDKGTILRPLDKLDVDAYVDADFAGLYDREPDHLPEAVKSRAGWVITIAGCPALWKSALIPEIALSTTHAEYVALSQCMRVIIPLIAMMKEVLAVVSKDMVVGTTFHSTVFEDNMGALHLANN